LPLLQHLCK